MRAVVVGRFQPLHKGHEALVRQALDECDEVVVAVGSSQYAHTADNPFSFEERAAMVEAVFGGAVAVVAVPDLHDPPNWVAHLRRITGPFDVVYGNDAETLHLFEDAGVRTVRPGLVDRDRYQATVLRARLAVGDPAWRESVPDAVEQVLESFQAEKRLHDLSP